MKQITTKYSSTRRFLTATCAVVVTVLSLEAAAYRDALKSAQDFLSIGAYSQAIEQFEAALGDANLKGRNRGKAENGLAEARAYRASELFALGQRLESRGQVQGAVNAYREAANLAPTNTAYQEKFASLNSRFAGTRKKAADALSDARESNDWLQGLDELEALNQRGNVPEVRFALDSLKEEALSHYLQASDFALQQGAYETALDAVANAARFSQSAQVQNKKLARHHLLQAQQAWDASRYNLAYQEIEKSIQFEPDNSEILRYQEKLQSQWMGILYNEALQATANGNLELAKEKLTRISRYQPGFLDVASRLAELDSTLVSGYYEKAEDLMRSGSGENAGLALIYYMVAAEQQAQLYPDIQQRMTTAKQFLRDDLQHRVSLNVKNNSPEPGADGIVRNGILSSLKGSSLRNLQVLERDALDDILREQGLGQAFFDQDTAVGVKKIRGIQSGIYVDIVRFDVTEHGRDRPSYGSAKYVSGSRFVPNPRYSQLQQEVAIAQQGVLQARQAANKAQSEQNRMLSQSQANPGDRMSAIASIGSLLSSAGSSSTAKNAQRRLEQLQYELAAEPPQYEEDVSADFRYEIYDLDLTGEVVLSYKIVDFATSEVSEAQTARARRVVEDRWVPGDPGKGVASDPMELPSQQIFKQSLLDAATESLIAGLEKELSSSAQGNLRRARRSAAEGDVDQSMDSYVRFLYGGADLKSNAAREAADYIYEETGVQLLRKRR